LFIYIYIYYCRKR